MPRSSCPLILSATVNEILLECLVSSLDGQTWMLSGVLTPQCKVTVLIIETCSPLVYSIFSEPLFIFFMPSI